MKRTRLTKRELEIALTCVTLIEAGDTEATTGVEDVTSEEFERIGVKLAAMALRRERRKKQ